MIGANATRGAGKTLGTLELERGYYRTSETSLDILECHREEACVGGSNASRYCAAGYRDACKHRKINFAQFFVSYRSCLVRTTDRVRLMCMLG